MVARMLRSCLLSSAQAISNYGCGQNDTEWLVGIDNRRLQRDSLVRTFTPTVGR
jgi:hypothetical protein